MLVILTIVQAIISLMIAGIAFGIQYFVGSSQVEFLWMWLYCAIGWLSFFILMVTIAGCTGRKRMRDLKIYLETVQHEGGELVARGGHLGVELERRKRTEHRCHGLGHRRHHRRRAREEKLLHELLRRL